MLRRLVLLALSPLLVPVAACSGGDDDAAADSTVFPVDTGQADRFAFTSTIHITEDGFRPRESVATVGQTLTFVNETARQQTITFTNGSPEIGGAQTIGPIAPGGSMAWPKPLASPISLVYESDALPGVTGQVQIDIGIDNL